MSCGARAEYEAGMTRTIAFALAAASLAACSHAKVQTEFDPKAEFPRFKTWSWIAQEPGAEQAQAVRNPAVLGLIRAAVERELAARGLVAAGGGEPDLLVAVHGFAQDRIEVTNYGYVAPVGPYGWYGAPMHAADVRQYREGTLILDLVDARSKQLVWRATATDTVTSPSQVQQVIDAAVRDMLVNYPPKQGK
jgi:hypothetical protein